jgi:hypothetical protein
MEVIMETFRGQGHLPGADRPWNIEVAIDWQTKEVNVRIDEAPGGITEWPGLVVQTFGPMEEIAFRTKGIPSLFTHWWHFARGGSGDLWGIVLATPDAQGVWRTCPLKLSRVSS